MLGEWPPGALRGAGRDVTSAETICSISVSVSSVEAISGARQRCGARLAGATAASRTACVPPSRAACVPPSRTACVPLSSSSQQAACLMKHQRWCRMRPRKYGGEESADPLATIFSGQLLLEGALTGRGPFSTKSTYSTTLTTAALPTSQPQEAIFPSLSHLLSLLLCPGPMPTELASSASSSSSISLSNSGVS